MEKKWPMAFAAAMLYITSTAQVQLNVHTGTIITTNHPTGARTSSGNYKGRIGFVLGANIDGRLFKNIWSESGLSYNRRRFGYASPPQPNYTSDITFNIGYLTLNQHFLVKIKGKNGWAFSSGAGFFGGVAFHGHFNTKTTFINGSESYRELLDLGNNIYDDYRQFDAGANLLLRLQYKKVLFNFLYSHSLTDHSSAIYNNSYKEKFRGLSFTVGYEF